MIKVPISFYCTFDNFWPLSLLPKITNPEFHFLRGGLAPPFTPQTEFMSVFQKCVMLQLIIGNL